MISPRVSVVIPAYNASQTLKATVKSVFDQTFQDFEIIIVDDGSTKDNTLELARSIAREDARVQVISQANGGVSSARNAGIEVAVGEYVALLDADDLWVAHKLERQLEIFESDETVTAMQSGAYFVNNNLEIVSVRRCFESKDVLLETLLFQNLPNAMSTTIIKRGVFEKIGYFDVDLPILEDWEFMIRLARFCNLKTLAEPLSLYRVHPNNRSKDLAIHIKPGYLILKRLFSDPTLPESIKEKRSLIYAAFYRMLCGGAFNVGRYAEAVKWSVKSLVVYPPSIIYMLALPVRRLRRKNSPKNLPYVEAG